MGKLMELLMNYFVVSGIFMVIIYIFIMLLGIYNALISLPEHIKSILKEFK